MTALVGYLLLFLFVAVFFVYFHLVLGKQIRPSKPHAEKLTIYECGEPTIGSAWIQFDLRFYVVALLFVIFDVEVAFFFPWAVVFGTANQLASQEMPRTEEQQRQYTQLVKDLVPPYAENKKALEKLPRDVAAWSEASQGGLEVQRKREELSAKRRELANRVGELTQKINMGEEKKTDGKAKKGGNPLDRQLAAAQRELANTTEQAAKLEMDASGKGVMPQRDPARQLAILSFWDILVFFGVLLIGFAYLWKRGDLEWVRTLAAEEPTAPAVTAENKETVAV